MLPRKFRLSIHDDIEGLIRKGARLYSPFFVIRYRPNTINKLRCAIIASAKIAPKAVHRNRLRRLLYKEIYTYIKIHPTPNVDLAILPTKKALTALPTELITTLKKSLSLLPKK